MKLTNKKILIFSPLPPIRSGVVDYAIRAAKLISSSFNITFVTEQQHEAEFDCLLYEKYKRNRGYYKEYVKMYHIGNSKLHYYAYKEALISPSIIILHDFVLHHMLSDVLYEQGHYCRYIELLSKEVSKNLAVKMVQNRRDGIWSRHYLFALPLNGEILCTKNQFVVHSNWMKQEILQSYANANVEVIPHFSYSLVNKKYKALESNSVFIGCFGLITQEKQINFVIKTLVKIVKGKLNYSVKLVLAGQVQDEYIKKMLNEHNLNSTLEIVVTGFLPEDELDLLIDEMDIVLCLRYPSAGETSGILSRALSYGKACIVFNYMAFRDYPDSALIKLKLDTFDSSSLEYHLHKLIVSQSYRDAMGRNAKLFMQKCCDKKNYQKKLIQKVLDYGRN